MKKLILLTTTIFILVFATGCSTTTPKPQQPAQGMSDEFKALMDAYYSRSSSQEDSGTSMGQPYKPNAYGLGVHMDQYGRAFQWKTQSGQPVILEPVQPNAYGPGVGMDVYGRPVKQSPWGW